MSAGDPFALAVRAIGAYNIFRHLNVRVEGVAHLPLRGPALIAARHYHHLYDGAVLVHRLPRQPFLFVALDWTRSPWERLVMETACNLAGWPIALRSENLASQSTFAREEGRRYGRRSLRVGADILLGGHVLAVFPEGYPTIDPAGTRKSNDDEILPFRPGMLAIVARAERAGSAPIPIIPAGFAYAPAGKRLGVTLRLGAPSFLGAAGSRPALLEQLRTRVRELSA